MSMRCLRYLCDIGNKLRNEISRFKTVRPKNPCLSSHSVMISNFHTVHQRTKTRLTYENFKNAIQDSSSLTKNHNEYFKVNSE